MNNPLSKSVRSVLRVRIFRRRRVLGGLHYLSSSKTRASWSSLPLAAATLSPPRPLSCQELKSPYRGCIAIFRFKICFFFRAQADTPELWPKGLPRAFSVRPSLRLIGRCRTPLALIPL